MEYFKYKTSENDRIQTEITFVALTPPF